MKIIKRNIILFIIIFLVGAVGAFVYSNRKPKLTSRDNERIVNIVNDFYNNMSAKRYEKALELTSLSKQSYEEELKYLNNPSFHIKQTLDDKQWIIPTNGRYDYICYDEKSKMFYVDICMSITYNNTDWIDVNDYVYFKKSGNDFKIYYINTSDKHYYARGSGALFRKSELLCY